MFGTPVAIFLYVMLHQLRYQLTIELVGVIHLCFINFGLVFSLFIGAATWIYLMIISTVIITMLFKSRWVLIYGFIIMLIIIVRDIYSNDRIVLFHDLQLLFTVFSVALLYNFYNRLLLDLKNQAERKTQDIKRFLASFSHELRSPLQSIIGVQDIIKDKVAPEHERYLLSAQAQSQLLLRSINDILCLTKSEQSIDALSLQPISLEALLESEYKIAQLNIGDKPVQIELFIDENIPSLVSTDGGRIHQIIQNLCSNAIKYTDTGTIHLSAEYSLSSTGLHDVTFIVSDTGQGIAQEQLTNVTKAFYQTSYINSGIGLGLHICQNLLRAFGSQLHIQSALGSGSTFSFTISFTTPFEEVNEPLLTDTDLSLLTAHINTVVIVDDSDINIAILTEQLKMCNVNVMSFLSGEACIDFCQTTDAFDVILMDMMMPNMNGIETSRALRKIGMSKPIIAISAANEQFNNEYTEVVNNLTLIQGELDKPFTALQIAKSLNAVCQ